jgi:hypothetical protein
MSAHPSRSVAAVAAFIALLPIAACGGAAGTDTAATGTGTSAQPASATVSSAGASADPTVEEGILPADEVEAAESSIGDVHLKAGQKAEAAAEGTALEVTVSDPKIIKAPDGWGGGNITVATVLYNVIDGQIEYDERAFALVTPDGEHIDASRVASDTGLPGHALGHGPLTGPDKAKGLVTFDHDPKSLKGVRIRWAASPAGFTWDLS